MFNYKRYAIYFAPARGSDLARLGAAWLGWDADAAETLDHPEVEDLPAPLPELTETPRKYGLHGTLKPPFRIAEGFDVGALDRALIGFAAETRAFSIPNMRVTPLGHFVAITPVEPPDALQELAADCVAIFDPFRAPLTPQELEKRRKNGLTERQESLLTTWGYPYVLEEFRFHLTLSGALDRDDAIAVAEIAQATFADALKDPIPVEDICLFGEQEDGRFTIIRRYALSG